MRSIRLIFAMLLAGVAVGQTPNSVGVFTGSHVYYAPGYGVAALAAVTPAPIYYVDGIQGSDSNSGLSQGSPFKTIAHINSSTFAAGSSVLFHNGQEWHEELVVPSSGMTFGTYGPGAPAIISAADTVTGWVKSLANTDTCSTGQFCSGFETSGLTDWTGPQQGTNVTLAQSTTSPNHGTYSLQLNNTDGSNTQAYLSHPITTSVGNAYSARFYLDIPTAATIKASGPDAISPITLWNASNNAVLTANLIFDSNGNTRALSLYDSADGQSLVAVSSFPNIVGGYHEIELDWTISASNGGGVVIVDGTVVGSSSGLNTSQLATATLLNLGNLTSGAINANSPIYFDDFKFAANAAPVGVFGASSSGVQVWKVAASTNPYLPNFAGQAGTPVPNAASMNAASITASNQYAWDGSNLSIGFSGVDPTPTVEIPQRPFVIDVNGQSNITIQNLVVQGAQSNGIYCNKPQGCPGLKIVGDTIRSVYTDGVAILSQSALNATSTIVPNAVQIFSNNFYGIGGAGITLDQQAAASGSQIGNSGLGNTFTSVGMILSGAENSVNNGSYTNFDNATVDAIKLYSDNDTATGGYVGYNQINGGLGGGIHLDTVTGWTVEHNSVLNMHGWGIQAEKDVNSLIHHNMVFDSGLDNLGFGMAVRAGEGQSSSGTTLQYNTVVGGPYPCGEQSQQNGSAVTITNVTWLRNQCIGDNTSSPTVFNASVGFDGTGNAISTNDFFPVAPNFVYAGGTSYNSCSSLPGTFTANFCVDPQYVNSTSLNFTLLPASQALGTGNFPVIANSSPSSNGVPIFGTPASSSAACMPPQVMYDASFTYYCVAPHTWKESPLNAF